MSTMQIEHVMALVRSVPGSFARSLCLRPAPVPIDVGLARRQHERYVAALAGQVEVLALPADEDSPDCCFIEDTAVVIGDRALVTHPGAPSRRGETAATLATLRSLGLRCAVMAPQATLDGGDVLVCDRFIFVGMSGRTSEGALREVGAAFPGHEVVPVPVAAGLHLKSAITRVTDRHFLVEDSPNGRRIFGAVSGAIRAALPIWVAEPHGANALRVGERILHLAGRPRLAESLAPLGLEPVPLDMSELEKADGGLTCLSILLL